MDYLAYWGLFRNPFTDRDNEFFFAGMPQRETLAGIHYFIASSWNLASLASRSGHGTSRLLRRVQQMSGFGDCAAEVILTPGTDAKRSHILGTLADALGMPQESQDLCDEIGLAIDASDRQGIRTVWLIDRCHSAAAKLASDLAMAHQSLSVVMNVSEECLQAFSGQSGHPEMLLELDALSLEDTMSYVRSGLEHAGCKGQPFLDAALVRLHEFTDGRLKDISRLAEIALQLAAAAHKEQVVPQWVEAAYDRVAPQPRAAA